MLSKQAFLSLTIHYFCHFKRLRCPSARSEDSGHPLAICLGKESQDVLKISTQTEADKFTLKIEGKVVGDWAIELGRVWAELTPSLGTKKLELDICGVLYLDGKAKQVLKEIVAASDAEILADSLLTKQFADELSLRQKRRNKRG